jgi:hypothetical protein
MIATVMIDAFASTGSGTRPSPVALSCHVLDAGLVAARSKASVRGPFA